MMASNAFKVWALLLLLTLSAPAAWCGEPRTHDGFFLRLSAGAGYASTSMDAGEGLGSWTGKLEISGGAGDVNIAIGGVIATNLALHATLLGWAASEPDVTLSGWGSGELNGDLTLSGLGVGLTYYFMPSNLYLTGTLGAAALEVDLSGGPEANTDAGVIFEMALGKEWWSGKSWGLGLAGSLSLHSIPDGDIDEKWTGAAVGLRFSATYN